MQNYIYSEVLEPAWHQLDVKLRTVGFATRLHDHPLTLLCSQEETVSGVLQAHRDYMTTCLKECMLMDHDLLKVNFLTVSRPIWTVTEEL